MASQNEDNLFKFAHQFPVRGIPARRVAEFSQWWMGVNHQTTSVAYSADTNEVRIAMLIEAPTPNDAIREARRQIGFFKQDATGEETDPPIDMPSWPDWAEKMIEPFRYKRAHGDFPPTYRPSREPPPDLVTALRAMANPATAGESPSGEESYEHRTSILLRPPPVGLYESLGQIAAHGAALEQALGDLVAQLARVSGTAADAEDPLAHHRGRFSELVRRAKSAVDAAGGYIRQDVLNATQDFVARVEGILDMRNQFIHSQWWWSTESDGPERLVCRRLPQSSQETSPVEWLINDVQDLVRTGRYFKYLDWQSRFLVARIMALADRVQGVDDAASGAYIEMDLGGLSVEERVAILSRLRTGLPPEGLEFLGPVADVEPVDDSAPIEDQSAAPRIRFRVVDDEQERDHPPSA